MGGRSGGMAMLLTNRRHRLLFGALAGMELSWILPFALLFVFFWVNQADPETSAAQGATAANAALLALVTTPAPILLFFFWGIMLAYMLAADMLNRSLIESPGRELILVALVLGTSILSTRLLLYPTAGPADFGWFGNFFDALFNFHRGRRPELALLLLNFLLWFRVASLTGRELSFFRVGLSFRLGLLLAILGSGLLNYFVPASRANGTIYLFSFFAFGLTAVALARMDEKALQSAGSRGANLPWPRFFQTLGAVGVILAGAWGIAQFYTPAAIRTVLSWFSPVWSLIGLIASRVLLAIAWVLAPLLERMILFLRRLFEMSGLFEEAPQQQELPAMPDPAQLTQFDVTGFLDEWAPVRYALVIAGLLAVLVVIWLFFMRTPQRGGEEEAEEYGAEALDLDGNLLQRGLDKLKDWADLIRRYGLGTQLLAAISVQNIYANVSRLARGRGFPRAPSQPPDEYLAALRQAFPDCADELRRITDAYMRVEYGDHPIAEEELAQLRQDFQQVQRAPAPAPDESMLSASRPSAS
jgi:uncharacterized membrane protein YccF (DUF307 family)